MESGVLDSFPQQQINGSVLLNSELRTPAKRVLTGLERHVRQIGRHADVFLLHFYDEGAPS